MPYIIALLLWSYGAAVAGVPGNLPIQFEPNAGQAAPDVKFLGHGGDAGVLFTQDGWTLALPSALIQAKIVGANQAPQIEALEPRSSTSNYIVGSDPKRWRTGIPQYGKVRYRAVYPGVDLVFYGNGRELEYDFVIHAGGEAGRIRLRFSGVRSVRLEDNGDLILDTDAGVLRQRKPVIYQQAGAARREVAGGYAVDGDGSVRFTVAEYDRKRALIIDPVLVYSTYLGEIDPLYSYSSPAIATDASGNAYIGGSTRSDTFPTTPGTLQQARNNSQCRYRINPPEYIPCSDAFVAKMNAAGTALVYSTYLGGAGDDAVTGIAVDASGNAYITGITNSADFPTTVGAVQGQNQGFTAKLDSSGGVLVYSTTATGGGKIAIDSAGGAYVAREDVSSVPSTMVEKLNANGTAVVYSYRFSATTRAIAVDGAGRATLAGDTSDPNFPTTPGAFQPAPAGGSKRNSDAFVVKLNSEGSAAVYSTLLGGTDDDYAYAIAVDSAGEAYVTGGTVSGDFPVSSGSFQTTLASSFPNPDAFVAKIDSNGARLVYSTYLGGGGQDVGNSIAVDSLGNVYAAGGTNSRNFPTTRGAFQPCFRFGGDESRDGFVARLRANDGTLLYSTYLGGRSEDFITSVAAGPAGNAYVAGFTRSADFPVADPSFQSTIPVGDSLAGLAPMAAFVSMIGTAESGPVSSVCVVSAASFLHGRVSPGEIISIFGAHTGPAEGFAGTIDSEQRFNRELAGTRVLFDGIPAPLLYVQENQINAIVPYGIAGRILTDVQIEYGGQVTGAVPLVVAAACPGIFTLDMSGIGQGAIINQDGTVNSATNPAKAGSFISIYATGEGLTVPPSVDGELAKEPLTRPVLPVRAFLDGMEAEVQYAGGAPTLTAGVIQVNVKTPEVIGSRRRMQVSLKIGEETSQPNVTVEIAP